MHGESAVALAGMLAGFGTGVDPIDPPEELVVELRRVAGELAERWLDRV